MTRLTVAVAAIAAATSALAQPSPPLGLRVVPVYTTPLGIRLSWTERGGVDYYNIRRQVDDGVSSIRATVSGGSAGQPGTFLDEPVVATSTYTYTVQACDRLGCGSDATFTTSVRATRTRAKSRNSESSRVRRSDSRITSALSVF